MTQLLFGLPFRKFHLLPGTGIGIDIDLGVIVHGHLSIISDLEEQNDERDG